MKDEIKERLQFYRDKLKGDWLEWDYVDLAITYVEDVDFLLDRLEKAELREESNASWSRIFQKIAEHSDQRWRTLREWMVTLLEKRAGDAHFEDQANVLGQVVRKMDALDKP